MKAVLALTLFSSFLILINSACSEDNNKEKCLAQSPIGKALMSRNYCCYSYRKYKNKVNDTDYITETSCNTYIKNGNILKGIIYSSIGVLEEAGGEYSKYTIDCQSSYLRNAFIIGLVLLGMLV